MSLVSSTRPATSPEVFPDHYNFTCLGLNVIFFTWPHIRYLLICNTLHWVLPGPIQGPGSSQCHNMSKHVLIACAIHRHDSKWQFRHKIKKNLEAGEIFDIKMLRIPSTEHLNYEEGLNKMKPRRSPLLKIKNRKSQLKILGHIIREKVYRIWHKIYWIQAKQIA